MDLEQIPVQVIRSPRRKTSAIKILESAVEVRVPHWVDHAYVEQLLSERRQWIEKHYAELKNNQNKYELSVTQGHHWPFKGQDYELVWQRGRQAQVTLGADKLHIVISVRAKSPDEQQVKRLLQQWYRQQAEAYLQERLDYWAQKMGLTYRRVQVKSYRRRWGSCSAGGDISLNWRLIMVPIEQIDYVLIHELAHLRHFNHGREFWALVAVYCQEWQTLRKLLNQRSTILQW